MKSTVEYLRQAANLTQQGNYPQAEALLERVLAKNPTDGTALHMIGTLYAMAGRRGLAIPYLSMACAMSKKSDSELHLANLINLAPMLRTEGHNEESERVSREAIKINPKCAEAWNNLASCYVNAGNPEEGERYAREAVKLNPELPEAQQNLGQCLLEQGKWSEAWDAYEWRFRTQEYADKAREYKAPYWDGKKVGTLVVHGEQGLGDEIMFLSLIKHVKPLCDRLIIEANGRLRTLLRRSLGCEVAANQEEAIALCSGSIDAVISMGSLGRLFRRTEESFSEQTPYIKPDAERVKYWRSRIEAECKNKGSPFIALGWHGGTQKTHAECRNPPVELFADLIQKVPANFISVQYTKNADLQARLWGIPHWQEAIDDLDEQAALISACDLTVSVAQTALHLSGAMGKPTIALIGSKPAWRYGLTNERMIWYPSVEIVRQKDDDWVGLMRAVIGKLSTHDLRKAA